MRARRSRALLLVLGATVAAGALGLVRSPAADADGRDLLVLADRLARDVSAIRGLAALRPVRRGVLDRERILARIQELVNEQYTPEEIRHEGDVLKRMGLVPPDLDYAVTVFGVLREQVAGFYDPHARRLFIASWLRPDLQEPTLAHEIQHALQDQHYRIGELLRRRPGASDRQAAVSALCEGDAVAVMIDYLLRSTGRDFTAMPDLSAQIRTQAAGHGQPLLRGAPRAIRESLLFPYVEGTAFVRALKMHGRSWAAVDAAFASPPDSTEQILHPERYIRRDAPMIVALADDATLSATYRAVHRDVLGELSVRLYLEESIPAPQARAAAAGWGGDQVVLYERTTLAGAAPSLEELAIVARVQWDTEADAQEFVEAATLALDRRFARCQRLDVAGGVGRAVSPTLAAGLLRQGATVAWVEGVPHAALAPVLAAVFTRGASPPARDVQSRDPPPRGTEVPRSLRSTAH